MINLNTLDISRIDTDKIWAFCPFHKDVKKASLEICIEGEYAGKAYCWGCGYREKLDIKELELFLGQKISVDCREEMEVDWDEQHEFYAQNCTDEDRKLIASKFNVDWNLLKDVGLNRSDYTVPMRDEFYNIIGIQVRSAYEDDKWSICGSKLGLFLHPDIEPKNPVIITEGWSDFITALDLGSFAIGRPSARYGKELVYKWLKRNLPDYKAIIVGDADKVGIETAIELRDYIDSEGTRSDILFPQGNYKDLREWVAERGKKVIQEALQDLGDLLI